MKRTLYHILGVDSKASCQEIEAAYQTRLDQLAATPMPDPSVLALVREAHRILSNVSARSTYDASLTNVVTRVAVSAKSPGRSKKSGANLLQWAALGAILLIVVAIGWRVPSPSKPPSPPPVAVLAPKPLENAAPPQAAAPPREQETSASVDVPRGVSGVPAAGRSAEDLFSQVSPSIVRVVASGGPGGATSQGSGVVIERGTVVTNCHVIARGISVTVRVGADTYAASTLVSDEELDLCSLSVPGLTAPAVNIGSIGSLRIGQRVYAVGTPYGLDLTISEGIISSLREVPVGKVIQTTAPISPGSSGGGLFNLSGELVGIMTFQHRYGQNLNFAHPAEWIEQMRTRTASSRNAAPSAMARGLSPVAPTAPRPAASPSVLIVGAWRCLTIATGRISEFYYGNDGTVIFAATDGRGESGRYSVVDDRIVVLAIPGQYLSLNIVSLTQAKMVLKKSANYSEWLSCDRK